MDAVVLGYVVICLVVYALWIVVTLRVFKRLLKFIGSQKRAPLVAGILALILAPGLGVAHSLIPFPATFSIVLSSYGLPETWWLVLINVVCLSAFWGLLMLVAKRYYFALARGDT